ncbi:PPOX class F420-dependent oxidoreductase [Streptomyces sp. SID14478]|uniref:PPOX class F420-dependent oxidoreductase n=1 Tax=Streptomyces sp. SID14478 TaxID=2706073 RepID=UPI0013DD7EAA|nr:PPOX class F420-dependent oxidoreductase [Streptomyces sp. SID14478]NEB79765.1 PPOX class F420-dependent oxidoreductase [Streptomyces sp. SID14478]
MSALDEIRRSKHISLTTYRKNGTSVSTPVWHVPHGDELLVVTPSGSWKVKRIRNNSAVTVTACDVRGRTASDATALPGTARLLDEAETEAARGLLAKRYVMSRVGNGFAKLLRLRRQPMTGIAVTL